MLLQRALTEATRSDYVPLPCALPTTAWRSNPETLAPIPDPTYSDAMYYAVESQDYAYYLGAGDPTARLHAWVADGQACGRQRPALVDDLLRRRAMPVVAEHPDGRSPGPAAPRRAVPDVRADGDPRPGHPDRQCTAHLRTPHERLPLCPDRRTARDLRTRSLLSRRCDQRLPRGRDAAIDPDHGLRRGGGRSVRRESAAQGGRLPDGERIRDVGRAAAPQHRRLQLSLRLHDPDAQRLRLRRR